MSVAYAGVPGAFSHQACLAFLPDHEPVARESFELVIEAVEAAETELGILPLANNGAGETGARELIDRAAVRVVSEEELPVRLHLLGLPGSRLDDVRTVVSHPIALRQCTGKIAALGLSTKEAGNTAAAAAALTDGSRAVLASEQAARIYCLEILQRDMHDRPDNMTIFAVIARDPR